MAVFLDQATAPLDLNLGQLCRELKANIEKIFNPTCSPEERMKCNQVSLVASGLVSKAALKSTSLAVAKYNIQSTHNIIVKYLFYV